MSRRLLAPLGPIAVLGLALTAVLAFDLLSRDDNPAWMQEPRYRDYAAMISTTTLEPELQPRLVKTLYLLDKAAEEGAITDDFAHIAFSSILARGPNRWVGTVVEATPSRLAFEVFATGETVVADLTPDTLVKRNFQDIAAEDLRRGELVEVTVRTEGDAAYLVRGFWAKP